MNLKRLIAAIGVAVSCIAAACGSSSQTAVSTPTPVAATIQGVIFSFSADFVALTTPGATAQATALGVLANGSTQDITANCVNWQSDNASVLTVNSHGLMTAQSASGAATITTTCQGVSARGLVTLNPPPSPLPGAPPIPAGQCTNPPYEVTTDANGGRQHCREAKTGEFAFNVCCGLQ